MIAAAYIVLLLGLALWAHILNTRDKIYFDAKYRRKDKVLRGNKQTITDAAKVVERKRKPKHDN